MKLVDAWRLELSKNEGRQPLSLDLRQTGPDGPIISI